MAAQARARLVAGAVTAGTFGVVFGSWWGFRGRYHPYPRVIEPFSDPTRLENAEADALELMAIGKQAFRDGDYAAARTNLYYAQRLSPRNVLYYALGSVHRRWSLTQPTEMVHARVARLRYKQYLAREPMGEWAFRAATWRRDLKLTTEEMDALEGQRTPQLRAAGPDAPLPELGI